MINRSDLRERSRMAPTVTMGEGWPDLHCFYLGDEAFTLTPWMVKPYRRRQFTREKRIFNYTSPEAGGWWRACLGYQRAESGYYWGQWSKGQRLSLLHNMLRTHQCRADRATLRNDQVVYVRDDNYRNPLREAIQQQDPLKECFNHYGHWRGRMTGPEMCQPTTLGPEEPDIHQSFSVPPSCSFVRTFI